MSVKIIPYESIHALSILEKNVDENDIRLASYPNWEEMIEGWKTSGPAFTMIADEGIVGCAGIILMGYGRGEAWVLTSPLFYKYVKKSFRAIKEYMDRIAKEHQLRRIQAFIDPIMGFEACHNFLKHLGFRTETPEGLEAFGPTGQTLFLYKRIYQWPQYYLS